MKLSDTVDLLLKHKGREIWSVSPDQSVYEAIEKTADKEVGALLVVDAVQHLQQILPAATCPGSQ